MTQLISMELTGLAALDWLEPDLNPRSRLPGTFGLKLRGRAIELEA